MDLFMKCFPNSILFLKALLVLGLLILNACGGGGGGGGGGGNSNSNSSNNSSVVTDMIIDSSNATNIISATGSAHEAFIELASVGVVSVDMANRSTNSWHGIVCDKNGTFSVSLVDRDNNQMISAGDSIGFQYTQCDMRVIGGQISGSLNLDVTNFSDDHAGGNWLVLGKATIDANIVTSAGTIASIKGAFNIDYKNNNQKDEIRVFTSNPISIAVADHVGEVVDPDSYYDINIVKIFDVETSRYSVSGAFSIVSGSERLQCSTFLPFEGLELAMPESGEVRCTGARNTAVRGGPQGNTNNIYGTWYVDLDSGSGIFSHVDNIMMAGDFDGMLFTPTLLDQPYGAGAGFNKISDIQIVAYTISKAGKVYVVTASSAPILPKRLIEINPLTGGALRSIALSQEPSTLVVTADGSQIFVGYQNTTGVDVFDANQWALKSSITLGQDTYNSSNYTFTVNNMIVGSNNNYVIVEAQSSYGTNPLLFAFQDGTRLPNSVALPVGFSYFVKKYIFDAVSNLLFFRTNDQFPISYVQVGVSGLTNFAALTSVGGTTFGGNGFDIYGSKIYSANGGIIDISTKGNVGYLPCNQAPCATSFEDTIVDPYLKQVLYIGGINALQVYALNSKALLSFKSIFASKASVLNQNQIIYQSGNTLGFIGKGNSCWLSSYQCSVN